MRYLSLLSLLSGLVLLSGCLLIQDADEFTADVSCGVDISLCRYFPHAARRDDEISPTMRTRRQLFEVRIIREDLNEDRPANQPARVREAVAFFDPLPSPDVQVLLPFAAPVAFDETQSAASLELLADQNRSTATNNMPEPSPADHSWVRGYACGVEGSTFRHTTDFDDLQPFRAGAFSLRMVPAAASDTLLRGWQQDWIDNALEVRVVRRGLVIEATDEELDVARAFARRERSTDVDNSAENAQLMMRNVLRDDEGVDVTFMLDRNGNGERDADDIVRIFEVSESLPLCNDEADVCLQQEGNEQIVEIRVREGVTSAPDTVMPWWRHLPETTCES